MRPDRLALVLLVGLLLWGGAIVGAGTCLSSASANEPVKFETEREKAYWESLVECNARLEVAERRLEGEREKVRTTTTTINLACPAPIVPACPPCPECGSSSCLLEGGLGVVGGLVIAGGVCAIVSGKGGGADVVIAR